MVSKVLTKSIIEEVDRLESNSVELLQDLVRIPSVTGKEAEAQEYVADYLCDLGLEVDQWFPKLMDLQNHPAFCNDGLPLGERPVVIGRWKSKGELGRTLILNGHMDVVPPGDEKTWIHGPWSGVVHDGQLYGRGSCDMKGGLVSGIIAIAALRNLKWQPAGEVLIQSVIGEETGGVGTLATVLSGYRADAAIILEPTKLAICPVGAGAASFRLYVRGRAAHGAMRLEGISAVEKFYVLFDALNELERNRNSEFRHPYYKMNQLVAPLSIGKVQAGDWPSTVPESLIAEGRFGVLPGENIETARLQFEQAIARAAEHDEWLKENPPRVEWFEGQFEPSQTPADSPIIQNLEIAHKTILGRPPTIHGVTYGSDMRFFTNYVKMHAVLYGPGDVSWAHSINEHIPVEEVMAAAKVIALTIVSWCD